MSAKITTYTGSIHIYPKNVLSKIRTHLIGIKTDCNKEEVALREQMKLKQSEFLSQRHFWCNTYGKIVVWRWWRLTHTPRLGSTPLGVGLAGESGVPVQPVAPLTAHLTLRPFGRAAIVAPQEAVLGSREGWAGADCGLKEINVGIREQKQTSRVNMVYFLFFLVFNTVHLQLAIQSQSSGTRGERWCLNC